MLLHRKIRDIRAGDLLEVVATDPCTGRDIPRFCTFLGHQLVDQRADGETFYYYIRKANQ